MATPRAAEHRDLEQRLRRLEQALQSLTSVALRRSQLSVTEGDFVVSGGGDVVVQDGGRLLDLYPTGEVAFTLGTFQSENDGALFQIMEEDGTTNVFQVYRIIPNGTYPDGYSSVATSVDALHLVARGTAMLSVSGGPLIYLDSSGISISGTISAANQATFSGATGIEVHNRIRYLGAPTTGSAANVRMDTTTGDLQVVSSSRRYKTDIRPVAVDADAVLSVSPATWVDRDDTDEQPARHVGFIAEELDAAGLGVFVDYDEQGRPDAIQYDRLSVALHAVAVAQQERLDDLERRVAALEG